MLERIFKNFGKVAPENIVAADSLQVEATPALESKSQHAYRRFLNLYLSHIIYLHAGEEAIRQAFCGLSLEIGHLLMQEQQKPELIELQASYITETMRDRAMRQAKILREQALDVLVDQRNYLLTEHLIRLASIHRRRLFEEEYNPVEPAHAFASKLMADCSLKRGLAQELDCSTIEAMATQLRERASRDMLPVLPQLSTLPPVLSKPLEGQCRALQLDLQLLKLPALQKRKAAKALPAPKAQKNSAPK